MRLYDLANELEHVLGQTFLDGGQLAELNEQMAQFPLAIDEKLVDLLHLFYNQL